MSQEQASGWRKAQILKQQLEAAELAKTEPLENYIPRLSPPMPTWYIEKNFAGWESLEQIVRWVEGYHGIGPVVERRNHV